MTTKPDTMSKRVVTERHSHGPLKGKASKWFWACSVCGLVYVAKWCANVCCFDRKDRFWLKPSMRPFHDAIGRLVDGEFIRFKKVEMKS